MALIYGSINEALLGSVPYEIWRTNFVFKKNKTKQNTKKKLFEYVHANSPSVDMVPKWRRINVDATSSRRIDVHTTSFLRHVPAGSFARLPEH